MSTGMSTQAAADLRHETWWPFKVFKPFSVLSAEVVIPWKGEQPPLLPLPRSRAQSLPQLYFHIGGQLVSPPAQLPLLPPRCRSRAAAAAAAANQSPSAAAMREATTSV
jgi:hypothetical protein